MQIISLESDLHRERKERSEEASMFSRMLLKVTEAEEEARALRERVAELEAALGGRGPAESLLAKQLQEMRALMAHTAELFEDLDRREQAISEFRSRGLQEARAALLRAAGPPPRRPSPPKIEDDVDVSEMIEIVESLRPPKPWFALVRGRDAFLGEHGVSSPLQPAAPDERRRRRRLGDERHP